MKTAILLNEDLSEMRLGVNTTLAYILDSVNKGSETYLVDVRSDDISKVKLLKKENCQNLIDAFKQENRILLSQNGQNQKFVKDIEFEIEEVDFDINDCDFLIQRLDPTHAPFPPKGKEDYHQFLRDFFADKKIKNQDFNYPVDCYLDKEFPVAINLDIEIKTWLSFVEDDDLVEKILKAKDFSSNSKIVLKPDNSGQSMGVFAIEFKMGGKNLVDFTKYDPKELQNLQIYHIEENLDNDDLKKIALYLLFVNSIKYEQSDDIKKYEDLNDREIIDGAKNLYSSKIVIQPFIAGVSRGDIRINVVKKDGKFEVVGVVFRKSLQDKNSDNFTTCVTSNMARPVSVYEELTDLEVDDLVFKMNKVMDLLNGDLAKKYARSFELGFDFILKGNGKEVLLNEVNHACPALVPVAQAIRKEEGDVDLYERLRCP